MRNARTVRRQPILSHGREETTFGKQRARIAPRPRLQITNYQFPYCTVSETFCECDTTPSVAVTVTVYVPRAVGTLSVSLREPDFVVSAWEVAVMFTVAGRPGANVGAVYRPLASIVPLAGAPVTAQVTALLEVLF